MEGPRSYEVKAGDSLWKISKQHYGEGRFWTRLYVHNNRPEALRVTKKPILDPNLIHPGQLLLLPAIPADVRKLYPTEAKALELANADAGHKSSGSNAAELVRMRSFPFKYKLDNEFGPIPGPGYSWKLKVSGTIVIAGKNALPLIAITQKSAELAAKKEVDGALAKSIHESKLEVDFLKKQVKYENMLTIKAGKGAPASASLGTGMSPAGKPILKARIVHKGLAGTFDKYVYFTPEVKFDLEIEPEPPSRRAGPAPVPVPVPIRQDLSKTVGLALIAGGIALIAATLVEDVLTAFAGVVDDPLTLSAALAMIRRGAAAF